MAVIFVKQKCPSKATKSRVQRIGNGIDEEKRIIGACASLSRRWPLLHDRFGRFHIEDPVSDAMKAFLTKVGDAYLMEYESVDRSGSCRSLSMHNLRSFPLADFSGTSYGCFAGRGVSDVY